MFRKRKNVADVWTLNNLSGDFLIPRPVLSKYIRRLKVFDFPSHDFQHSQINIRTCSFSRFINSPISTCEQKAFDAHCFYFLSLPSRQKFSFSKPLLLFKQTKGERDLSRGSSTCLIHNKRCRNLKLMIFSFWNGSRVFFFLSQKFRGIFIAKLFAFRFVI